MTTIEHDRWASWHHGIITPPMYRKDSPMTQVETKQLQPFQQRVVDERFELDEKLEKLTAFLGRTDMNIPQAERSRLLRQRSVMAEYSEILTQRILAF